MYESPPPPHSPHLPPPGPHDLTGPDYVKAALIGGVIAGVPSAFLSCCCFLFFTVGGVVGGMVASRTAPVFRAMEGAVAGFAAAIGGGVTYAVIYTPLVWWMGKRAEQGLVPTLPGLPPGFDLTAELIKQAQPQAIAVHLVVASFVFAVSSTLGGCGYGLYVNRSPYPPGTAPPPGY